MLNTMKILIKNLKFKAGHHARISKYKNVFAKGYAPNWSEEVFVVSKTKNTVPWTYMINDLNDEEITGRFYEKELQKASRKRIAKGYLTDKGINCTSNRRGMIIYLIVRLIKKISYKNELLLS